MSDASSDPPSACAAALYVAYGAPVVSLAAVAVPPVFGEGSVL